MCRDRGKKVFMDESYMNNTAFFMKVLRNKIF